jgi:hypothetical protein
MAWVKLPRVRYTTATGGWHVETQTVIVPGSRADVKCISSVQRPAGADGGVVVDKAFSSNWRDWCFVEVIKTVALLVGRFSGIMAREAKKVEYELNLLQKNVPHITNPKLGGIKLN